MEISSIIIALAQLKLSLKLFKELLGAKIVNTLNYNYF